MSYVELAWRRDAAGISYIDDRIEDLLGYTAEEMKHLTHSAALTPWVPENFQALLSGEPDTIIPHIFTPYPLRHKRGYEIQCEIVAICRYDKRGELAELFGMVRNYPCQERLCRFLDWWLKASDMDRQAVCGLAVLLADR